MFLRFRLRGLEKKLGERKRALVIISLQDGKVTNAYRTDTGGASEDLGHLIGRSLKKAQRSLKQYRERGDKVIIVECGLDPIFGGRRQRASKRVAKADQDPLPKPADNLSPDSIPIQSRQNPEWKQDRETWAKRRKERPSHDVSLNELMNMLDGLTPRGFDKNGRKRGPIDSGRPVKYIN